MTHAVKFIFKTLIGTAALIVVIAVMLELFNVQITATRLNSLAKVSIQEGADYFGQETYKKTKANGTYIETDMSNIKAEDGTTYLSGKFYNGTTAEQVYADLYTDSAEYNAFLNSSYVMNPAANASTPFWKQCYWISFSELKYAMNGGSIDSIDYFTASEDDIDKFTHQQSGYQMIDELYTPLNLGVAYLDVDTLTKIYRWNLTQLLSNCNPANIRKDESGDYYVAYSGFRCYTRDATIDVTYETLDLATIAGCQRLEELTHITPAGMGFTTVGSGAATRVADDDPRRYICIAKIYYDIPVSYEGIGPLKSVYEWIWTQNVEGLNSSTDYEKPTEGRTINYTKDSLTNKGNKGLSTGEIVYYHIN